MELKRKVTEAKTEPKKATEEPDEEAWKRDERKQVQSFIIESLGWLIISTAILVYLMHGGLPLWAGLIFCIAPLLLEYTHLQRLWPEFTK